MIIYSFVWVPSWLQVKKAKAEAAAGNGGSAGHGEDESVSSTVVSTLMMENLRMEKLLTACYQVSNVACNLVQNDGMCLAVL